ncbi:exocyst complex component 8-like isoform X2 [Asterias rubens]|uniref:exocyst complex component 8-like isoform X2 n=1 Tax=Asterias rubens TaxID=7604 RepID=UPI00145573CD|nr:exocyst complex component 8-like isoform X2 [Asterias rubens]
MADHVKKNLSKDDFDAQKYVFDICSGGDVYNELLEHRQKVQHLSEDTAIALKKNVYRNYTQFIETAKEISYLEGEMYQLSHVLTEQKSIMSQMLEMSIGKKASVRNKDLPQNKDDQKRTIASLLDRVEGCSRITEVPGRYIVHDGDLVELDTDTFSEVQRVHAYLLNDSLVITTFVPNRRGPVRYKYQALYELDSLAVVNVRDVGPVKNAFKILMFPDQRIYRADNSKTKRTWLDKLEEAKKTKAAADTHRRELAEQMSVESNDYNHKTDIYGFLLSEAFDEDDDVMSPTMPVESSSMLKVDWLIELPEDLDMCIAQRNFEEATDLIIKTNEYLDSIPQSPALKEMRARVDHRVKQLTEVLTRELQVSPDRSLRGGPQVTRRAVTELIRLGRATQACDLFLKNRSASIKQSLRQLRIEGATSMYITKLCGVFFNNIIETGKEFRITFSENQGCFSAFVVWSKAELKTFANHFSRQALAKKTSVAIVAECVGIARTYCQQLSVIGLELLFAMNTLLLRGIREAMQYNKEQLIEASRHRNVDERWYPLNLKNPNAANNLIQEMFQLGFEDFNTLVYDSCFVSLSSSNVAFTKVLLSFLLDALKLYVPELYPDLIWTIKDVMESHVHLMETAVMSDRFADERPFIMTNIDYLFTVLLPHVEKKIKGVADRSLKELKDFRNRHRQITRKVQNLGALI